MSFQPNHFMMMMMNLTTELFVGFSNIHNLKYLKCNLSNMLHCVVTDFHTETYPYISEATRHKQSWRFSIVKYFFFSNVADDLTTEYLSLNF